MSSVPEHGKQAANGAYMSEGLGVATRGQAILTWTCASGSTCRLRSPAQSYKLCERLDLTESIHRVHAQLVQSLGSDPQHCVTRRDCTQLRFQQSGGGGKRIDVQDDC